MRKKIKPSFEDMEKFVNAPASPRENTIKNEADLPNKRIGRPKINKYETDVKLTLSLPKNIHKSLKLKAVDLERPMAELIVTAVKEYLKI
ncbi:MAG: hypothetical protein HQK92_02205 [Nitrospirae bacterium]|nr:hypothetical protein [Nitrospirota bacterium]